jgi:pimeloyl-ACP methyl ester carboxylesterase
MADGGEKSARHTDDWYKAEVRRLLRPDAVRREVGSVAVGGEVVQYEIFAVDAREERGGRRPADGWLGGNVIVVVPGHGQTVEGPRKLVATAALLSKSKMAWCIDPVPSRGGDRTEALAIAEVTRQRLEALGAPARATLIGWSHGGSEALRAAGHDPELFPQYLGLCPTGLVDRHPLELLGSFFLEVLRILGRCLHRRAWARAADTLRMGLNLAVGLARDLWRGRSLRRLVEDVGWAACKVPGREFGYTGEVVLLCGAQDTVVRWQDALPGCANPDDVEGALEAFRQHCFPRARRVEMHILDGDHVAPETEAPSFLRLGLGLMGQLDED